MAQCGEKQPRRAAGGEGLEQGAPAPAGPAGASGNAGWAPGGLGGKLIPVSKVDLLGQR